MRWARALIAIAAVIAAAVTACSSPPPDMTVKGTLQVAVQDFSEFAADYPAATNGNAQVTITDPSGKVIAVTTADGQNVPQGPSVAGDETVTWGWTAKVPEGLSFYGISVQDANGKLQYTQAQMKQGPATCVGDACSG